MNSPKFVLISSIFLSFLVGCTTSSVLNPTEEKPVPVPAGEESTISPNQTRVKNLLQAHRYQGVGLEFETEQTLDLLFKVFSDSRTWNRKVKMVYTGLQMAYDARYQSLTVGNGSSAELVIAYILKNVPIVPPQKTSPAH